MYEIHTGSHCCGLIYDARRERASRGIVNRGSMKQLRAIAGGVKRVGCRLLLKYTRRRRDGGFSRAVKAFGGFSSNYDVSGSWSVMRRRRANDKSTKTNRSRFQTRRLAWPGLALHKVVVEYTQKSRWEKKYFTDIIFQHVSVHLHSTRERCF
jgi:hypothetical protein